MSPDVVVMDLAVPKKDWVEACREIVEAAPYLFIEGVLRPQTGRGQAHSAAVICLAPRRCDVILAMLGSGRPYSAEIPHHETMGV